MPQRKKLEKILGQVEEDKIRFIHLVFMDILGFQKTVVIPANRLERTFSEGAVFDGSSVVGYTTIDESDLRLFPDVNTFVTLPWYSPEHKTAQVICNIHESSGRRFAGDPRYILERSMEKAASKGWIFNTGPEYEYFLFKKDENGGAITEDRGGYFDLMPMDRGALVAKEIISNLLLMNIEVEAGHHEVAPSQYEIDLKYSDGLTSADRVSVLKYAIKTLSLNRGLHATFMPKPMSDVNGSGMHVHQSFISPDGVNLFHDAEAKDGLSELCMHYMAGLLENARGITAILNSWPNSYKRLVPGFEAPVYVCWAKKNRSALVRVPPGTEMSTRLEMRSPDSAGNPYLQFAVLLAAGMDGIERKLEAPPAAEKDVFKMTEEQRSKAGIQTLPSNIGHAISLMEESKVVKDTLGEHVMRHFMHAKLKEWDVYRTNVSSWELERYLQIL
ncbi:MAG: type I glutamate--ammonia ligase [Candidatus Thermoplasmatota archaeon]|nr:type I glutamate--ammonia ligase [Candidatus Thermoplasmatota archaeon]